MLCVGGEEGIEIREPQLDDTPQRGWILDHLTSDPHFDEHERENKGSVKGHTGRLQSEPC